MPTAHALLALDALRRDGWPASVNGALIDTRMVRAVNWLLQDKHQETGTLAGAFADDPAVETGTVHQTALAYLAIDKITEAGVTANGSTAVLEQARTFLLDRQSQAPGNGSWGDDSYQTALVLRVLPAVDLPDFDQDGLPDGVEPLLGTDAAVADAHTLLPANGLTSSLRIDPLLAEVLDRERLYHLFEAYGGALPYTWSLIEGTPLPGYAQISTQGRLTFFSYEPGRYTFAIQLTDATGASVRVPVQIQVIDPADNSIDSDGDGIPSAVELANGSDPLTPNPSPVEVFGESVVTIEDRAIEVAVLANDSGGWGAAITVVSTELPANGEAQITANGQSVTYTPAQDFIGSDVFSYTVRDAYDGEASGTVSVEVVPVNDPPIGVADTADAIEQIPLLVPVLANDSDAESQLLSIVDTTPPSHGKVIVAADGQTLLYTGTAGYTGPDHFSYQLTDGQGNNATAEVSVAVSAYNPPTAAYQVLDPVMHTAPARAVSLVNDNTLLGEDGQQLSLETYQLGEVVATGLVQGMAITGNGPFTLSSEISGVIQPVPTGLAGTAFVVPQRRSNQQYYLLSPEADTNATIDVGDGSFGVFLPRAVTIVVDGGVNTGIAARIHADQPILVAHRTAIGTLAHPVLPAAGELWGLPANDAWIGALEDDTRVWIYTDDGRSTQLVLQGGQALSTGQH